MTDQVTEDDFSRDPEVELEAVRRLHYTVPEVKRKTIHALKKELGAGAQQRSPPSNAQRTRQPSPPSAPRVAELKQLLQAKVDHVQVLERDLDFDQDDLDDWHESIARLQKQIADWEAKQTNHLALRWQRKQRKLKKLDQDGLLDEALAEKWREKQQRLKPAL